MSNTSPLQFKHAPNLNSLLNIPVPSDSNIKITSSLSEETFIEDILKLFYFSKDLKSFVFIGILGVLLKLYDNIIDWEIPITNYIHEWFKSSIVIVTTITFLFDLNAVYGLLCFQIFNFNSKIHGIDTDFFHMGMILVSIIGIINFFVNRITLRNFIELSFFALIGYCESLFFTEEVSDSKFFVRFFIVIGGIFITLLDLTGILKLFSKNIIQIIVCGIFYIVTDLCMIMFAYFYDSSFLKSIMKKDKLDTNFDMNTKLDITNETINNYTDQDQNQNNKKKTQYVFKSQKQLKKQNKNLNTNNV